MSYTLIITVPLVLSATGSPVTDPDLRQAISIISPTFHLINNRTFYLSLLYIKTGYDDSVAMPGLPGTPADLPFWVGLFLRLTGR